MGQWLTPDNPLPSGVRRICVALPDDDYLIAQFWGAYKLLTFNFKWQQHGTATPEDVSRLFFDTFEETIERTAAMGCLAIGTIVDWSGDIADLPNNYLVADGSNVLIADYPDLATLYGNMWGIAPPDYFKLPNAMDRFNVACGATYTLGATGGLNTVTLTTQEIPAHQHTYEQPVLAANLAGELPEVTVTLTTPGLTGSVGGGRPHENRPPFFAFWKCIIAR